MTSKANASDIAKKLLKLIESISEALPSNKDTTKSCYAINNEHRDMVHGLLNDGVRELLEGITEMPPVAGKPDWPHYSLDLTEAHAQATTEALDLYARIGIGQFEVLAEQVAYGVIPVGSIPQSSERMLASAAQCDRMRELCNEMKAVMGYSRSGSNGIAHKHNASTTFAAWEVKKVLDQSIAFKRNPNPDFRGVNYDGLVLRYTAYPAPVATYHPSSVGFTGKKDA